MSLSGRRSIAVNAMNLAGTRLLTFGLRGFYILFLASALGPAAYGLLVYAQSWTQAFLPLSALGLNVVLSREIGRDRSRAGTVASRVLALQLVSGCLGAVICAGVGMLTESTADGRLLILVLTAALVGRILAMWANNLFIAFEEAGRVLRLELTFRLLDITLGVAVVMAGGGALGVAAVFALTWSLQTLAARVLVRRLVGPVRPRFGDRAEAWAFIRAALPVAVGAIGTVWTMQGAMVLFRHSAGTGSDLGQLGLAMQAFMLLVLVTNATSNAAMPVLSRAAQREDGKDMLFLDVITRLTMLGGGAAAVCGMVLGPWLLTVLLGPDYAAAGRYLGFTLWLVIPFTVAYLAGNILVARDRHWTYAAACMAGAIVMSLSLPYLACRLGVPGAVLANGLGAVVWAAACLGALRGTGGFMPWRVVLRPAVAVLAGLAVLRAGDGFFHPVAVLAVALAAMAGAALALHVVSLGEWQAARALVRRRPGGAPPPQDTAA